MSDDDLPNDELRNDEPFRDSEDEPAFEDSLLDELTDGDEAWDEQPDFDDVSTDGEDPFSVLLHNEAAGADSFLTPQGEESQSATKRGARSTSTLKDVWENEGDPFEVSPGSILEAMLFVGNSENRPLTAKEMSALMRGVDDSDVADLVSELNETYGSEGLPFRIVLDGPGYRMELAETYEFCRNRFYREEKPAKLSQPVVDVLSLVAYLQPVTRQEIDEKRLRSSGSILNQLVRRRLISMEKVRDEEKRMQRVYRTTHRFLDLFGLESLDELPRSQTLDGPA